MYWYWNYRLTKITIQSNQNCNFTTTSGSTIIDLGLIYKISCTFRHLHLKIGSFQYSTGHRILENSDLMTL